jgi:hypothetical protein
MRNPWLMLLDGRIGTYMPMYKKSDEQSPDAGTKTQSDAFGRRMNREEG